METMDLFSDLANQSAMERLAALPGRITSVCEISGSLPLPLNQAIGRVVLVGEGSGYAAAQLLENLLKSSTDSMMVASARRTPSWVKDEETLLVFLTDRPMDEDATAHLKTALAQQCQVVVVCPMHGANKQGLEPALFWHVPMPGELRRALPELFWAGYTLFSRLGWLSDGRTAADQVARLLESLWEKWGPNSPVHQNPAKRQAGQLCGRGILVVAGEKMAPAGLWWRSLFAQTGKNWAQFENLTSVREELLEGIVNPDDFAGRMVVLFLRCPLDSASEAKLSTLLQEFFMVAAMGTDGYTAPGEDVVQCIWSAILFGEITAVYLAALNRSEADGFPATDAMDAALASF